jgi:DNA (cytosine-5)-methyltransferase 1
MIEGLIVDNFAGGGGASSGIEEAFGRPVDIAINHDPEAVAMHKANHPETVHICQSVWKADPMEVAAGRPVALAWFSPDCKHFSKAKGGRPVEKHIRDLAWVVVQWARRVKPRVIMLENVEEFRSWCEIDRQTGLPIKRRRIDGQISFLPDPPLERKGKRRKLKPNGETFDLWVASLRKAGFARIEWRELRGCDFGEPTIRKRLFIIARSDGLPIVWPEPSHGAGRRPYRTAANDVIDWSIPCPSIFGRKKSLAENTLRRIAHGVMKFVVNAAEPFIVPLTHHGDPSRAYDGKQPLPTVTCAHRGEMAVVTPYVIGAGGAEYAGKPRSAGDPLGAATVHDRKALVCPTMIQVGYGERPGQKPRVLDLHKPYGTCVNGAKAAVVAAFIAKHTTGGIGRDAREPINALTANGGLRGTCQHGQPTDEPVATVTASGTHVGQVCAFVAKYFGSASDGQAVDEGLHTVTSLPRFGLVTVTIAGEEYVIVDIGMRMLTARELARAQGFRDSYILDPVCDRIMKSGKVKRSALPISSQIRMIGNSVNRRVARALVAANCNEPMALEDEARAA